MLLNGRTRHQGYTLLELVIVIFIIGLISAVILLRSGTVRFERKVSVFAQQLQAFIQVCQQQAILQPAVIAVYFDAHTYQAYYYSEGPPESWKALAGRDSFWQARQIPADIFLQINTTVPLVRMGLSPQIVIQPSGDIAPLTIDIGYNNEAAHYRLTANDVGEIQLQELQK